MKTAEWVLSFASDIVEKISKCINAIAGLSIVATMVLIVSNIIMRRFFSKPILGAYEFTGFLTASVIGLSLAYCAVLKGHIAIDFVVDKFPCRTKAIIETVTNTASLIFLALVSWNLMKHGQKLSITGEVSLTTKIPFYPFIYLIAIGIAVLCLVILVRLLDSIIRVVKK